MWITTKTEVVNNHLTKFLKWLYWKWKSNKISDEIRDIVDSCKKFKNTTNIWDLKQESDRVILQLNS